MYDIWYLCLVFRRFFGILIINCAVVALCHRTLKKFWCSTKRVSTNNIFRRELLYHRCNGPRILMVQIFWWKKANCVLKYETFVPVLVVKNLTKPVIVPYTLQHQSTNYKIDKLFIVPKICSFTAILSLVCKGCKYS